MRDVIRHPFVDWEPLVLRLIPKANNLDTEQHVKTLVGTFLSCRTEFGNCRCEAKAFSVSRNDVRNCIEVAGEWFCERCLTLFLSMLDDCEVEVTSVEIGEPLAQDIAKELRHIDRSAYVAVPRKTVQFEDGVESEVESFTIGRWPTSVAEYERFVRSTGYVTVAERNGEKDTFRGNSVLVPFEGQLRRLRPATCLAYVDTSAYCSWAGVRLPTEAEWLAASVVDNRLYDRKKRSSYCDDRGRLLAMEYPDALELLGSEFVYPLHDGGNVGIRFAPQYVRTLGWDTADNRAIVGEMDYDIMLSFRVVTVMETDHAF